MSWGWCRRRAVDEADIRGGRRRDDRRSGDVRRRGGDAFARSGCDGGCARRCGEDHLGARRRGRRRDAHRVCGPRTTWPSRQGRSRWPACCPNRASVAVRTARSCSAAATSIPTSCVRCSPAPRRSHDLRRTDGPAPCGAIIHASGRRMGHDRPMTSTPTAVSIVLVSLLTLGACGGSDDADTVTTDPAVEVTTSATEPVAGETAPTEPSVTEPPTTEPPTTDPVPAETAAVTPMRRRPRPQRPPPRRAMSPAPTASSATG